MRKRHYAYSDIKSSALQEVEDMRSIKKTFDDDDPILLAALGRGSHQNANGKWVLTSLFEICDEVGAHLAIQLPEDDSNPNSCIGGGELNLLAGLELWKLLRPALTVFAYGSRSRYLHDIDAPSESIVMTSKFSQLMADENQTPIVEIFDEKSWGTSNAGTDQELHNIFTRANQFGIKNVAIVTVAVHVPRTALMIQGHLSNPTFAGILPQLYPTELILEQADPEKYSDLFARSVGSQSFLRTFQREIGLGGIYPRGGVNAYFAGHKQTASSTIVTAKA